MATFAQDKPGAAANKPDMERNTTLLNTLLAAMAATMLLLCIDSIARPLRAESEREAREAQVKRRLAAIRTAEEAYRAAHGSYTASLDTLVGAGLLADSLRHIPHSGGKDFELSAGVQLTKSGKELPLVECGAKFADYLRGLDDNYIATLAEEANAQGRYPGLKIGDLSQPNGLAGNWE